MACLARSIQRNIMLPGGKLQKKTIEVARYILAGSHFLPTFV